MFCLFMTWGSPQQDSALPLTKFALPPAGAQCCTTPHDSIVPQLSSGQPKFNDPNCVENAVSVVGRCKKTRQGKGSEGVVHLVWKSERTTSASLQRRSAARAEWAHSPSAWVDRQARAQPMRSCGCRLGPQGRTGTFSQLVIGAPRGR